MHFIGELREGERINEIYLCKQKQAATTKNGKPYENLILQDKTGVIDGKIWDPNSLGIDEFDTLDYIEIMGKGPVATDAATIGSVNGINGAATAATIEIYAKPAAPPPNAPFIPLKFTFSASAT